MTQPGPERSSRKTANEPVEGTDPGGTRPRPAHQEPADRTTGTARPGHHVQSGDENDRPPHTGPGGKSRL